MRTKTHNVKEEDVSRENGMISKNSTETSGKDNDIVLKTAYLKPRI